MALQWIRENPPYWDEPKARIVGGERVGVFDARYRTLRPGDIVPAEWWRVEDGGKVVGYGWLDVSWGDAEILLATDPEARGHGVGAFILEHLDHEARARGLNYLTNIVRPTHPDAARTSAWLQKHGFTPSEDGRLLRAVARHLPPPHRAAAPMANGSGVNGQCGRAWPALSVGLARRPRAAAMEAR